MSTDNFDELAYLAENPDVAAAVARGDFRSGRDHYERHGRAEGRVDRKSREAMALHGINRAGRGLEIGPSHRPLAPKRAGFDVRILDHASAADLRKKYAGHDIDLDAIEEVDFVWNGEPLPEIVGESGTLDWIVASHVIEHVPDFVRFLQQCETLLAPGGKLALVVPDKRYCFDHLSPLTCMAEVLDAFAERRTKPSPGQVYEHIANSCVLNGGGAWSKGRTGKLDLLHSFEQAREHWGRASTSAEYIDVHCWRFTPESFRLIVSDVRRLGLSGLHISNEFDTVGCEFFATLTKEPMDVSLAGDRLAALVDAARSVSESA